MAEEMGLERQMLAHHANLIEVLEEKVELLKEMVDSINDTLTSVIDMNTELSTQLGLTIEKHNELIAEVRGG